MRLIRNSVLEFCFRRLFSSYRYFIRAFSLSRLHALFFLLVTLLYFSSLPTIAAVNGLEEVGHSFQADMRGGTEVAVGDTALSQIRQPASCALHLDGRVDTKMTFINPIFKYHGPLDTSTSESFGIPNFSIGYVGPLKEKLFMGLTVYSKMGGSAGYKNLYPGFIGVQKTSSSLRNYAAATTFAYKFNEKLMVGVAPRVELLAVGVRTLREGYNVDFNKSYSVGAGYTLGLLYLPRPNIYLGASYRSSTWMMPLATSRSSLSSSLAYPIVGPLRVKAFSLPQRVSFGASYKPRDNLRFATEVGYLSNRNSFLGSSNLGGLINSGVPIGYQDLWILNAGVDYDFKNGLGVSAGYSFNTAPMSRNRIVPVLASTNQNTITYGVRYTKKRFWAGAAHMIGLPSSARNRNTSPFPGTPQYDNARVNEFIQSLTVGIGFRI